MAKKNMTENETLSEVGPTEALVRQMSATKKEPEWMLAHRLRALALWRETPMPAWGPDLAGLDLDGMTYYVDPNVAETDDWKALPKEITDTFEKLGIPKAERDYLGGVGAQFDSGIVYHRIQDSLAKKGVIFENMDVALEKYPEIVSVYKINNYSMELCGGPHVIHTGVLASGSDSEGNPRGNFKFKIIKEEAISAGIRRIKAILEVVL